MDEPTDTTVSRQEAAALLGVSLRTVDRWIPEGTEGRYKRPDPRRPGRPAPNDEVRIERRLITALTTAPGGDTTDDTD